jgi:hypothetical protein
MTTAFDRRTLATLLLAFGLCGHSSVFAQAPDLLPSWNDGAVKKSRDLSVREVNRCVDCKPLQGETP